jgi:hypothetical protein
MDKWTRGRKQPLFTELSPEDRADLIALARDGSVVHWLARRANALVLLNDALSFEASPSTT